MRKSVNTFLNTYFNLLISDKYEFRVKTYTYIILLLLLYSIYSINSIELYKKTQLSLFNG